MAMFGARLGVFVVTVSVAAAALAVEPAQRAEGGAALVVSELQVDPLLVDDAVGEYVELVNLGPGGIRVADIALLPPSGKVLRLTRPRLPILPAGGVMVVRRRPASPFDAGAPGLKLPNRAGRLEVHVRGKIVDVVHWLGKWPWPKYRAGRALERTHPRADGRLGRTWRHSRQPLRGAERGTPGQLAWSCKQLAGTAAAAAVCAPKWPPGPYKGRSR